MTKVLVCVICGGTIGVNSNGWVNGHNAYPITEGRCCNLCNTEIVIPARLSKTGYSSKQISEMPDIIE